jgi:competence protein CoiA
LEAKKLVRDALVTRGLRAEVEYIVSVLPGDRRADVMLWSSAGAMLAIELQHTSIGLEEIEARAFSYARAGIAQIWIPFLSSSVLDAAEPRGPRSMFVERYSPRPFEKWVHGLNGKDGMWMYSPGNQNFWWAHLAGHQIYVEESSWFEQGGEEKSAGGYYRWSKRYRELTLTGPHSIDELKINVKNRAASSLGGHNWPSGRLGLLVPA